MGNLIVRRKELDDREREELNEFVERCNATQNIQFDMNRTIKDKESIKYLLYEDKDLIAYVNLGQGFNKDELYMMGIVDSNHLDYHEVHRFIERIKKDSKEKNINYLKIINQTTATNFEEIIEKFEAKYTYSTYEMKLSKLNYTPLKEVSEDLYIKRAKEKHLNELTNIGMSVFETTKEEEENYNRENLRKTNYKNFIAYKQNKSIGMVSTKIDGNRASIADLAVLKEHRRNGIGSQILSHSIFNLMEEGIDEFNLTVESENDRALNLYKSSGFEVTRAFNCYRARI